MEWLSWLLASIDNNLIIKGALLWVGGMLITRDKDIVRKAVPTLLGIASFIVAILNAMFPSGVEQAELQSWMQSFNVQLCALVAGAEPTPRPWWQSLLFDAIIPWIASMGWHSGGKNTKEWVQEGSHLKH